MLVQVVPVLTLCLLLGAALLASLLVVSGWSCFDAWCIKTT